VLGQDLEAKDVAELMTLFARALRDLGGFLMERYEGRFEILPDALELLGAAP
jgi:hypothetical protein